jgi:membrane protein required for colicin V production
MMIGNVADMGLTAIIFASIIISTWRGFSKEILMLASAILAVYTSYRYGALVGEHCTFLSAAILRNGFGHLLVFMLVSIAASLLRMLILKFLKFGSAGVIDRIAGGLFGLLRGSIAVSVLITTLHNTPIVHQDWWEKSTLIPYVEETTKKTLAKLPGEWKEQMVAFMDKFNTEYA